MCYSNLCNGTESFFWGGWFFFFERPFWPFLWIRWPWNHTWFEREEYGFISWYFSFDNFDLPREIPIQKHLTIDNFFSGGSIFWTAILTISMPWMIIKPYIIRKRIERALMWLLFHSDRLKRLCDTGVQKIVSFFIRALCMLVFDMQLAHQIKYLHEHVGFKVFMDGIWEWWGIFLIDSGHAILKILEQ